MGVMEMKRVVLWLVGLGLLAALLAGCGGGTEASQGQAAKNAPPSPEVVDPGEADAQSQAAGETPSILGSTPEAGQVGTWERDTFFETWEIGYPDGWQAEQSGENVILTGAYGSEQYRVELTQPASVEGDDVGIWAKADVAAAALARWIKPAGAAWTALLEMAAAKAEVVSAMPRWEKIRRSFCRARVTRFWAVASSVRSTWAISRADLLSK